MYQEKKMSEMSSIPRWMMLLLLLSATASAELCRPGQWRSYSAAQNRMVCSECLDGYRCPDGVSMLPCDGAIERTVGTGNSQCCPLNMTCASIGYAVVKDCLCRPMRCADGGRLMHDSEGGYGCYYYTGCPDACTGEPGLWRKTTDDRIWVQTPGCQCVLAQPCQRLWKKNLADGYECLLS